MAEVKGSISVKDQDRFVGITIPDSLHEKISEEAKKKERSVSAQIRYILKEWVEENA